jgi:hypothetical protein
MFDCTRPLTGCTEANATESTKITDLFARVVGLDTHVNGPPLVSSGNRVFFDTSNHELRGQIVKELPNPVVDRVTVNLPAGFRSLNRLVTWGFPSFSNPDGVTTSGTINCPSGTAIDVRLLPAFFGGVTVNVKDLIC